MAWGPDRRSNFFSPPANLCAVTCITEITNSFVGTNSLHFFGLLLPLFLFFFLHVPLRVEDYIVSLVPQLFNSKLYLREISLEFILGCLRKTPMNISGTEGVDYLENFETAKLGRLRQNKINMHFWYISGAEYGNRNLFIYSCFCSKSYFPRSFCCHWYFKLPANYNLWVMT